MLLQGSRLCTVCFDSGRACLEQAFAPSPWRPGLTPARGGEQTGLGAQEGPGAAALLGGPLSSDHMVTKGGVRSAALELVFPMTRERRGQRRREPESLPEALQGASSSISPCASPGRCAGCWPFRAASPPQARGLGDRPTAFQAVTGVQTTSVLCSDCPKALDLAKMPGDKSSSEM